MSRAFFQAFSRCLQKKPGRTGISACPGLPGEYDLQVSKAG